MDTKELEQVIYKVLETLKQNSQFTLLVICGDNRYCIEKFLIEAEKISEKKPLKFAVDENAFALLSKETLERFKGVKAVFYGKRSEDYDEIFKNVDTVIFGCMDIGTASKIGNLVTDTLSARIASEAFIRGIRIISNTFTDELEIKNEHYKSAVNGLIKKLNGFGMEFIPLDSIKKQFSETSFELMKETKTHEKVITENFVKALKGRELRIGKDAVVTPLAKDVMREKNIVLTRGR